MMYGTRKSSKKKSIETKYVEIIEQPSNRVRFRYEREGRTTGCIYGETSTKINKTYPTIKLVNCEGPALITVSCVTKESPYRPHPHNLIGKFKQSPYTLTGVCYHKIERGGTEAYFHNISIQCVRKVDVDKSLEVRKKLGIDPFNTGFDYKEDFDLNTIRLCFQVTLIGQAGAPDKILDPVVSQPISDKKSANNLTICWLSHASAPASGGKVMCILCEKIVKHDIQVKFSNGKTGWEAIAETTSPHFHKQVALIFKSPKYLTQHIAEPVLVQIQLKRISDGQLSDPVPFQILPMEADGDSLKRKRKKLSATPQSLVIHHLQAEVSKNASAMNEFDRITNNLLKNEMSKPTEPKTELSECQISSLNRQANRDRNTFSGGSIKIIGVQKNLQDNDEHLIQNSDINRNVKIPMDNFATVQQRRHGSMHISNIGPKSFDIAHENGVQSGYDNPYLDELLSTMAQSNYLHEYNF